MRSPRWDGPAPPPVRDRPGTRTRSDARAGSVTVSHAVGRSRPWEAAQVDARTVLPKPAGALMSVKCAAATAVEIMSTSLGRLSWGDL